MGDHLGRWIAVALGLAASGCVAPPRPVMVLRPNRGYTAPAFQRSAAGHAFRANASGVERANLSAAEKERLFRAFEQQEAEVK